MPSKKKPNKYKYWKIIQSNGGFGWDDESHYECYSSGCMTKENRDLYKHDLAEYRLAYKGTGTQLRTIKRKELNETPEGK